MLEAFQKGKDEEFLLNKKIGEKNEAYSSAVNALQ